MFVFFVRKQKKKTIFLNNLIIEKFKTPHSPPPSPATLGWSDKNSYMLTADRTDECRRRTLLMSPVVTATAVGRRQKCAKPSAIYIKTPTGLTKKITLFVCLRTFFQNNRCDDTSH